MPQLRSRDGPTVVTMKLLLLAVVAGLFPVFMGGSSLAQQTTDVRGRVVNGTDGGVVPEDLSVLMLITAADGRLSGSGQAMTDAQGQFVFEDVQVTEGNSYAVSVDHLGVFYGTSLDVASLDNDLTLTIFETTGDASIIEVKRQVMVIAAADEGSQTLSAIEFVQIENPSDTQLQSSYHSRSNLLKVLNTSRSAVYVQRKDTPLRSHETRSSTISSETRNLEIMAPPEMTHYLRPRKDQLGSVFLYDVLQLQLMQSKHGKKVTVAVDRNHPYLHSHRVAEKGTREAKSFIMWPLTNLTENLEATMAKEQGKGRAPRWTPNIHPTIKVLGLKTTERTQKDVPTWIRENLIDYYDKEDMAEWTGKKDHFGDNDAFLVVRQGDVLANATFYTRAYSKAFHKFTKILNDTPEEEIINGSFEKSQLGKHLFEDRDLACDQAVYTPEQIKKLINFAHNICQENNMSLNIAPQGDLNEDIRKLANRLGAKIINTSDLDETLNRYRHAKGLFLSNSYLGFTAACLNNRDDKIVYYPKNLMFTWLGVGRDFDRSGFHPMPRKALF